MSGLTKNDDDFINSCVVSDNTSILKDNVVGVDANYYLARILDHEPLVTALGGPLAAEKNINDDLDKWKANGTTPFFIFDGCPVKGEDDLAVKIGRDANAGTDTAWTLYSSGEATPAVQSFGFYSGAYHLQSLYPLLQSILRERNIHFLTTPFKAVSQLAYFSKYETMVGAIMGPRELLLYPIKDPLIQEIDWEAGRVRAVTREMLMNQLGVEESIFVDALLITGCSFLPPFPAKAQPQAPSNTVRDAVNMLRSHGKHVKQLCSSFDDQLKDQPDWFDKFCKARMIVKHFMYIAESGAVEVENMEALTTDSHEYLGIRLPEELVHYLSTGLIGPHLCSWISHSRMTILPTLDGIASDEYKNLVLTQLMPLREQALSMFIHKMNRALHFKDIEVKSWFPDQAPTLIRNGTFRTPNPKVATWDIEEKAITQHFSSWSLLAPAAKDRAGSLVFEVLSLQKPEFVKDTIAKAGTKPKTDSAHHLVSSVIWRFLHLRDYTNDSHELTSWGQALAASMTALEPTVKNHPRVPGLYAALLLAFELIKFNQLNTKPRQDELANGEVDPSLLLVSRCAVLLKLRHDAIGYTGPLRKDMLAYLSQVSAVREADRDLVEAILGHMFLFNKTKRERQPADYWDISNALPFVNRNYNAAMGVAVRTYLEQKGGEDGANTDIDKISSAYFPKATHFKEDFEIFCQFFEALVTGLKTLDAKDFPAKDSWTSASKYLQTFV